MEESTKKSKKGSLQIPSSNKKVMSFMVLGKNEETGRTSGHVVSIFDKRHTCLREFSVLRPLPLGVRSLLVNEEGRCITFLEQGHL